MDEKCLQIVEQFSERTRKKIPFCQISKQVTKPKYSIFWIYGVLNFCEIILPIKGSCFIFGFYKKIYLFMRSPRFLQFELQSTSWRRHVILKRPQTITSLHTEITLVPVSMFLLSTVSVARCQPWTENVKQKNSC